MTYNVLSGTLNPTQSLSHAYSERKPAELSRTAIYRSDALRVTQMNWRQVTHWTLSRRGWCLTSWWITSPHRQTDRQTDKETPAYQPLFQDNLESIVRPYV